jgi:hypothetical protein
MIVKVLGEYGYEFALLGLSLSRNKPVDQMSAVAERLAPKDGGHNKFLEFIEVWIDVTAPRYWWQQADTYRVGVSKQSESTMYTITRRPLTQDDFEGEIVPSTLFWLNTLIADGDWRQVKRELPESFLQRRIIKTNYKTLKRIRGQRKAHRLPEWHTFIDALDEQLDMPELLR